MGTSDMFMIGVFMTIAILVALLYVMCISIGLKDAAITLGVSLSVSAYLVVTIYFLDQGTSWFT